MDNQEIRDCIIDELKSRLVYENGTWCYERSDYSGRDFYENIPLRYVNDDEYSFLEEDVYEWSDCSDLDWDDFDEIYEEVFWELANGEIKESIQTNSLKITLNEDLEDDIQEIGQEFTSANTSINATKLPAVFNMVKFEPNTCSVLEKVSENDYSNSIKGIAYKVFRVKDGKLYPPMVANPNGEDTPIGVWLDAEEGEFSGLSKTGRKQVKSIGSGTLAYRPGWHLGDKPRAKQFDRSFGWKFVDPVDELEVIDTVKTYTAFINKFAKVGNVGNVYYISDIDSYVEVTDNNAPYFPYDFIWAECEYVMDINYQDEADEQGYMRTKPDGSQYRSDKYQHSLAGLPKLPKNGYYRYRTNPNPDTVPWVITGAIKVTKLLDDFDVLDVLGGDAPERQGGNKTLKQLGLAQI